MMQIATKSLQNQTDKCQYLANSSVVVFRIRMGNLDYTLLGRQCSLWSCLCRVQPKPSSSLPQQNRRMVGGPTCTYLT